MLTNEALPQPLRRFDGRAGRAAQAPDAPRLVFPPDGAVLAGQAGGLPVRVQSGVPPFTWMVSGAAVATGLTRRETWLDGLTPGWSQITVIDAKGRAARVQVCTSTRTSSRTCGSR